MSTIKTKNVQVGTDGTASNNFTIYVPGTPDGTVRIGNGDAGSVTDAVTINSSGAVTLANNLTVTGTASINGSNTSPQPSFRNLFINGNMEIHQRGGTITMSTGNYNLDRFFSYTTTDGVQTAEQSTDAPNGFKHSLKVTTTTADSSLAAGQRTSILQRVEGYNIIPLAWGTADAKTVTLSFWVKSSITGTHGGSVGNGNDTRAYPFTYTISSANTWEKKTLTIPGDTTGTWATTNGRSLQIAWGLGVGSTYSGTAFAWESADRNSATGATTDVIGTLNATWFITGVQLEVGSTATDFETLPYDVQLSRCQRYAYKLGGEISNYYADSAGGYYDANYIGFGKIRFPVPMRTAPSATFTAGGGINVWRGNTTYTGFSWGITISGNPTTRDCFIVGNKTSHGVTVDAGAMIKFEDTAANCLFSAEL